MAYDLGTAHGKIELEYTGKSEVDSADRDMKKLSKSSKETDKDLTKLKSALGGIGKGAGVAGLAVGFTNAAAGAANMAVQILGVVPQLTSILSLGAALPGIYVAGAAAVGVLKASFAGVSEAVTAAFDTEHPEKFAEAIKNLSPEAQAFATAVQGVSGPLREFQQGLQESFFSASTLTQQVPKAASALATLGPNLSGIASQFGEVTRQVANFALSRDSIDFVNNSLSTFRTALDNASPGLIPILAGLRNVGGVGLPLLSQLGTAVGNVATKFGTWLSQIAGDGRLQSWINTALQTLGTLGDIAQNVGGILVSVFQSAGASGGGLLNTIATITGQFNTFLSSAEGQTAMTALFTGLAAVAGQLAPVITTLAGALAGALGPALAQIATAVGPQLLQVVQALAPAFGPLAGAIADVLTAVAPLAPPLATLISMIAQLAGGYLSTIASNLGPVVSLLGAALTGALQQLQPVLAQVLANLPQFASAGAQVAVALLPLVPAVVQLASTFASALLPVLPQLIQAMLQLIPSVVQLATIFAGNFATSVAALAPLIPPIVQAFVAFHVTMIGVINVIIQIITWLSNLGTTLGTLVAGAGAAIGSFGSTISSAFSTAYNAVISFGGQILGWFQALPGRITSFISGLPSAIGGVIRTAVLGMARLFGQGIGIVITQAVAFPGRVKAAAAALPGLLRALATSAWNAVKSAFTTGVSAAVSFARGLPGKARSAISALVGNLRSIATSAWNALKSAFSSGVSNATSTASSLPGKIKGAVGNLGSLLVSAGRDAVMGLVNGIKGAIGAAVSAASAVGSAVIGGIKSTLKISSPSKVMITLGRYVVQGFTKGINGTASQVKSAVTKLANMVTDAFNTDKNKKKKGIQRLVTKGQKNTVLAILAKGNAQLQALSVKSAQISSKLKAAQANLSAVQKQYNDQYNNAVKKTQESFSLVTPGQEFVNLNLTKDRFKESIAQAKAFAANIKTLTKKGLHANLIQELVDQGPEAAGAMAAALAAADQKTIDQFTLMKKQLNGAAMDVGKTTADSLYGAGLNAAKGLVKGLQNQEKAIQKQMDKIAESMIKAIKKVLKIKSPSRVMFNLGEFTGEGLANGIASLRGDVERAAQKLAAASIVPTVRLGVARTTAGAQAAVHSVGGGASTQVVNQTVNALPGMNAKQVGDYALTKLRFGIFNGVTTASLPAPSTAGV